MPAAASPSVGSVRSTHAGTYHQLFPSLRFPLVGCGVGERRHLVVPSFPPPAFVPGATSWCDSLAGRFVKAGVLAPCLLSLSPSLPPSFQLRRRPEQPPLPSVQQRIFKLGATMATEGCGSGSIESQNNERASTDDALSRGTDDGGVLPSRAILSGSASSEDRDKKSGTSLGGSEFPIVTLDPDAVQKFAEIEVRQGGEESSEAIILIRGLKSATYHVEAAEPTMLRLREAGIDATITGGGRIKHSSKRRSIFIYGYSMQFGPANLPRVADLCRKQFPDFEVTWTEGGY